MTRRIVDREYAIEECDEVCQDINTRDRIELRQRNNRNCGCQRRNCECERRNCDYETNEVIRRRNVGNRMSGQECEVEDINTCCEWEDPCRWNRWGCNWRNECGCGWRNECGCNNRNRCGCTNNRNRCGCTRGLNCDRNRRLRSCRCECED